MCILTIMSVLHRSWHGEHRGYLRGVDLWPHHCCVRGHHGVCVVDALLFRDRRGTPSLLPSPTPQTHPSRSPWQHTNPDSPSSAACVCLLGRLWNCVCLNMCSSGCFLHHLFVCMLISVCLVCVFHCWVCYVLCMGDEGGYFYT